MKQIPWLLLALFLVTGCSERVDPGYVGIHVIASGTNRGVQDYPLKTGRVWYNPFTEDVFQYPTFMQTAKWQAPKVEGAVNSEISFGTADQMAISGDVSIGYQLTRDKVPAFYVMFRSESLTDFTDGYLRNLAREKFDKVGGTYKIEQILGNNGAFVGQVRTELQKDLETIGVELKQFGFIGAPRPPQVVIEAINAKVKATQFALQTQNEVLQVEAQARKNVAEAEGAAKATIARAEAEAAANRLLSSSLTPQLVEVLRLKAWDGKLPQVTTGSIPFVTLK